MVERSLIFNLQLIETDRRDLRSPRMADKSIFPGHRRFLICFIHGYLGSEESFEAFPLDLLRALKDNHGLTGFEARVYPKFDTHGDSQRAVSKLINWLLLHATTAEYHGVLLVAHSMGGLLACDAYRQLYRVTHARPRQLTTREWVFDTAKNVGSFAVGKGLQLASVVKMPARPIEHVSVPKILDKINNDLDENEQWGEHGGEIRSVDTSTTTPLIVPPPGAISPMNTISPMNGHDVSIKPAHTDMEFDADILNGEKSALLAPLPHSNDGNESKRASKIDLIGEANPRELIDIIGIICFDSPFFGLQTAVYTTAVTQRIVSYAQHVVPAILEEIPRAVPNGIASVVPQKIAGFSLPWRYTESDSGKDDVVEVARDEFARGKVISLPEEGAGMMMREDPVWQEALSRSVTESMRHMSSSADDANTVVAPPLPATIPSVVVDEVTEIDIVNESRDDSGSGRLSIDTSLAVAPGSPSIGVENGYIGAARIQRLKNMTNTVRNALIASGKSVWIGTRDKVASTDWRPITTTALGVGAIAGASVIAPGMVGASVGTSLVRHIALVVALKQVDEARKHFEFLYPLFGASIDLELRVDDVISEMENGKLKGFRNFFVELPVPVGPSLTANNPAPSRVEAVVQKHLHKEPLSDTASISSKSCRYAPQSRRTFIALPPPKYAYLFRSVDTDCKDEIHAHMNMFDRDLNAGSYWGLVNSTADEVAKAFRNR
ncbi:hypothetical protein SeLEV6574_g08011 [Synchytrium endobioticum]|uniref:DUF676 domain-containing protein n=1 Tax=Synchytrium endobioticum TaxID=286115 RepID=A0A507C5D7_9FUNG|nr:hypothetical protein SeLEV6574_g08011 [Synchytrium endobioticum]